MLLAALFGCGVTVAQASGWSLNPTLRIVELDTGFLLDSATGAARYFEAGSPLDPLRSVLDTTGSIAEIRSELTGSPTKVELVSRVERVGPTESRTRTR